MSEIAHEPTFDSVSADLEEIVEPAKSAWKILDTSGLTAGIRVLKKLLLIFSLCVFAMAQKKPAAKTKSAAPLPPTPTFEVKFEPDPKLSVPFEEGIGVVFAEGCDGNGNPHLQVHGPTRDVSVFKVSSDGVTKFETRKITDIVEPQWVADSVSDSEVYMLIEGDVHREQHTKRLEDGQDAIYLEIKGEPRYYIARFDADGSYKGALKLDLPFRPKLLSVFQSGDFLTVGYDESNASHVALLDSSGQLLRYIEFPEEKQESVEKTYMRSFGKKTPSTDASTMVSMFSAFTSLTHYLDDVLYIRGHSDLPIYEVRDGGDAKIVPIKLPKGNAVEYMLPSDRDWFFVSSELGKYGNEKNVIYEVNPSTGELLRRYLAEGSGREKTVSWQSDLACVHEGEFVLVRHGGGKLTVLRGTPVLATARELENR